FGGAMVGSGRCGAVSPVRTSQPGTSVPVRPPRSGGRYAPPVTFEGGERGGGKRDRAARLMRVAGLLAAHPDGMHPKDIAEPREVCVRNVYRALHALEDEVELPVWADDGRWGMDAT